MAARLERRNEQRAGGRTGISGFEQGVLPDELGGLPNSAFSPCARTAQCPSSTLRPSATRSLVIPAQCFSFLSTLAPQCNVQAADDDNLNTIPSVWTVVPKGNAHCASTSPISRRLDCQPVESKQFVSIDSIHRQTVTGLISRHRSIQVNSRRAYVGLSPPHIYCIILTGLQFQIAKGRLCIAAGLRIWSAMASNKPRRRPHRNT
jgi:hypothetical protein